MASGQQHVEMSQLDTKESRGVYSLADDRKERQPECKKHWTQLLDPLLALPCTLHPSLWDNYWQSQPKTRTQDFKVSGSLDRRAKQSQEGKQTKKDPKADFFFIIEKLGRCFFKLRQNKFLSLSNLISKATTVTKQKQWGSHDAKIRHAIELYNTTWYQVWLLYFEPLRMPFQLSTTSSELQWINAVVSELCNLLCIRPITESICFDFLLQAN